MTDSNFIMGNILMLRDEEFVMLRKYLFLRLGPFPCEEMGQTPQGGSPHGAPPLGSAAQGGSQGDPTVARRLMTGLRQPWGLPCELGTLTCMQGTAKAFVLALGYCLCA